MSDSRFGRAISRFDAINAEDPASETDEHGNVRPRELLHAERLTAWVERLHPNASEALRLAARCQHLGRFRVPRATYPEGRVGYLKWRTDLGRLHAESAEQILREEGFDEDVVAQVRKIVTKRGLTTDPDVQAIEDALCLAFLEHEYAPFSDKHSDEKLVTILQKTWRKMSPRAREAALRLPLQGRPLLLIERALSEAAPEAPTERP